MNSIIHAIGFLSSMDEEYSAIDICKLVFIVVVLGVFYRRVLNKFNLVGDML